MRSLHSPALCVALMALLFTCKAWAVTIQPATPLPEGTLTRDYSITYSTTINGAPVSQTPITASANSLEGGETDFVLEGQSHPVADVVNHGYAEEAPMLRTALIATTSSINPGVTIVANGAFSYAFEVNAPTNTSVLVDIEAFLSVHVAAAGYAGYPGATSLASLSFSQGDGKHSLANLSLYTSGGELWDSKTINESLLVQTNVPVIISGIIRSQTWAYNGKGQSQFALSEAYIDPTIKINEAYLKEHPDYSLTFSKGFGPRPESVPETGSLWICALAGAFLLLAVRSLRSNRATAN